MIVSSDSTDSERGVTHIEESVQEASLRGPPPCNPSWPSAALGGRSCPCCHPCCWSAPGIYLEWLRVPWTLTEKQLVERAGLDG